jgi:CDP-glycerol glycerophosphotransferase
VSKIQKLTNAAALALGRVLPVDKKKVVFSNYYGKGFGDNGKAIAEELLRRDSGLKLVWLTDEAGAASLPQGVTPCPYHSPRRYLALATAAVWVDNCRKGARYKKKGQHYLQTWHGFALKRIERDVVSHLDGDFETYARRDSQQIDLIVSDSDFMTGVYQRAFWYDGPVEKLGSPRNDLLARQDEGIYAQVRRSFGLEAGRKIVLYAPTFRADHSLEPYQVDYPRLRRVCEEKFGGKFAVLIRLHPNVMELAKDLTFDGDTTFDASPYPDMQELLAAADVVITDYSSLMFDFMLTGRPCFQFATDIEAYRGDRNFYFPLDQLPFALAENNDQLEEAISAFQPEDYRRRLEAFQAQVGLCTDGKAASRCADWILAHTG